MVGSKIIGGGNSNTSSEYKIIGGVEMETIFDQNKVWRPAVGGTLAIGSMETSHLINIRKLIRTKPTICMAVMIRNIESARHSSNTVWSPGAKDPKKESLDTLTSMDPIEFYHYLQNSPLTIAIEDELYSRGINIENVLKLNDMEDTLTE